MIAILDADQASISPKDRAFNYGDGCFTTIAVINNAPVLLAKHIARLQRSAQVLCFADINWAVIEEAIEDRASGIEQGFIKLVLSRGMGGRGYQFDEQLSLTCIISSGPFPEHYPSWRRDGITVGIHPIALGSSPMLAGIKHLNRLEQVMLKHHWQGQQQDFLCLNSQQQIICASAANVFFTKGNQVVTPVIGAEGINGVMRIQFIEFLMAQSIDVQVRPISVAEICEFDGACLTNSLMGAVSINSIDLAKKQHRFNVSLEIDDFNKGLGFKV